MAAAPVKAPESLAESQMRQLDNQEDHCCWRETSRQRCGHSRGIYS
jgi:hypothetical protein